MLFHLSEIIFCVASCLHFVYPYAFDIPNIIATKIITLDNEFLVNWFKQKLLGNETEKSEVGILVVGFVHLIANTKVAEQNAKLSLKVLEVLLSLFTDAFMKWNSYVKEYFKLLQSLALQHQQLKQLLSAISNLLATGYAKNPNVEALGVLLNFLQELLQKLHNADLSRAKLVTIKSKSKKLDFENRVEDEEELANSCCTYTVTGNNFMDQHWYYCYTCNLTFSEGVCGVCVKVCHKGHDVSYSRKSRFFCDCGSGARSPCKCLVPRKVIKQEKKTKRR